jgi:putative thioredoxin
MDITIENFEQDVVAASHVQPVLIDFWAPWCGPCRTLGPMLEKLEAESAGGFRLAKVNSDEQPELSAAFGVRSIPFVVAFKDGKPVDHFVGVLSEGELRAFVDRLLPRPAEQELARARSALDTGDRVSAQRHLQAALALDAGLDEARFELVGLLLDLGEVDAAKEQFALLSPLAEQDPGYATLQTRFQAVARAADLPGTQELLNRIEAQPGDLQARQDLANLLISQQAYEPALEQLLEIVRRDRGFGDDIGRKTMLSVFDMASANPELVSQWRRRLSSALF